ncbi:MAG: hypothetical protein LBR29_01365 [Methylobacteriaceae bacterium]|nr:hypothetical protein [Methylobacteriaceae bacterium]
MGKTMKPSGASIIALLLVSAAASASAEESPAASGWFCGTPVDVLDHRVSGRGVSVSSFSLSERDSVMSELRTVQFSYSVDNRSGSRAFVGAELAGFDRDNKLILAMSAEPIIGMVSPRQATDIQAEITVNRNVIQHISILCLNVSGINAH